MARKDWNGKHVNITLQDHHQTPVTARFGIGVASAVSLALKRLRNTSGTLDPRLEELMFALDYLIVGDPASTARWHRMEAAKGMDPSESGAPVETPAPVVRHPTDVGESLRALRIERYRGDEVD